MSIERSHRPRISVGHREHEVLATDNEIGAIAWTGTIAPAFPRFPRDKGLTGAAVHIKDAVISQDVANDPRYLMAFATTGSEAIFPVLGDSGSVIGTIDVECDHPNAFLPEDEQFLRSCSMALRSLWCTRPS